MEIVGPLNLSLPCWHFQHDFRHENSTRRWRKKFRGNVSDYSGTDKAETLRKLSATFLPHETKRNIRCWPARKIYVSFSSWFSCCNTDAFRSGVVVSVFRRNINELMNMNRFMQKPPKWQDLDLGNEFSLLFSKENSFPRSLFTCHLDGLCINWFIFVLIITSLSYLQRTHVLQNKITYIKINK